jgi:hypothetical protein
MAKFLLLLLLPLSLLRPSDALAQSCYCTFPYGDGRCYANTTCWACAPGAYDGGWQQQYCTGYQPPAPPPVTCTSTFTEKTESCPVNFSGVKKYKQETKTCTDGQVTALGWQLYADTCTPNPPSCQVTTNSQSLQCPTGYTGSITQMQTSSCPNPYAPAIMGPWATTANTCVKSITNPTNISSPVSPISPLNPASVVSPTATAVTMPTPIVSAPLPTSEVSAMGSTESAPQSQTSTATSAAPTAGSSAPQTSATGGVKETPKNAGRPALSIGGLSPAMSLEFFVKPGIIQPNVFPTLNIGADIPVDIRQNHQFLMELLSGHLPDQSGMFNKMAKDAIELEQ